MHKLYEVNSSKRDPSTWKKEEGENPAHFEVDGDLPFQVAIDSGARYVVLPDTRQFWRVPFGSERERALEELMIARVTESVMKPAQEENLTSQETV